MGLEHGRIDRPNGPAHEHHASVAELEEKNVSGVYHCSSLIFTAVMAVSDQETQEGDGKMVAQKNSSFTAPRIPGLTPGKFGEFPAPRQQGQEDDLRHC